MVSFLFSITISRIWLLLITNYYQDPVIMVTFVFTYMFHFLDFVANRSFSVIFGRFRPLVNFKFTTPEQ